MLGNDLRVEKCHTPVGCLTVDGEFWLMRSIFLPNATVDLVDTLLFIVMAITSSLQTKRITLLLSAILHGFPFT